MSITTKAVKAGIQGATSTAKGQVTKHYGNEIDNSPVSKTRKNIMHIGMQGAAAAGAVALAEIMMKAYDDMQKPQSERKIKPSSIGRAAFPTALGFSLGIMVPAALESLTK